jgi:hypothetical protein
VTRQLTSLLGRPEPHRRAKLVLSGFMGMATNPRVLVGPTPVDRALDFCTVLRERA